MHANGLLANANPTRIVRVFRAEKEKASERTNAYCTLLRAPSQRVAPLGLLTNQNASEGIDVRRQTSHRAQQQNGSLARSAAWVTLSSMSAQSAPDK